MQKACVLVCLVLAACAAVAVHAEEPVQFNRDIHPILSNNCFMCHGPDKNHRKAGLRLDVKEGLFRNKDGVRPVVPGKPADSEVYVRITSDNAMDDQMPPPKSGKKLTPQQISLIKRWIEQGATYQGHWAYEPPKRPAVPSIDRAGFVHNDIDRFVLARLAGTGLKPSPPADRRTLVRRLYLDLLGLPPTPQQVQAFVDDTRPDAYERLVDQLLASPHYGERMAVYWLDLVRFADTVGYHSDNARDVYPYRDYVINAFNSDKPFDQFTIEQIAGDLIPNATLQQRVASAYNRLLLTTEEGGAQPKEYAAKYLSDRTRNVATVWLAATMMCCQCHDHKFDPYTMKDFYSMEAFFADIRETPVGRRQGTIPVPDAEQATRLKQLDDQLAEARARFTTPTPEITAAQAKWEQALRDTLIPQWTALQPATAVSVYGDRLQIEKDGSILASGPSPDTDQYVITTRTKLKGITAFRLEAIPDKSLPAGGSGRAGNGNFVLTELLVQARKAAAGAPESITLQNPSATFEQTLYAEQHPDKRWSPLAAIDNDAHGKVFGWAILPEVKKEQSAVFETRSDLGDGGDTTLSFVLRQDHGQQHTLGRFRIFATTSPRPVRATSPVPKEIRDIALLDRSKRSGEQQQKITEFFRNTTPLLEAQREQVAALEKQQTDFVNSLPKVLTTLTEAPHTVRILPRGNWMDDSGEIVTPAVPHFLPQPKVTGRRLNRMDLAKWLVSRENPLTARVFVNRLWRLYFGTGLSKTLEDLGSQGEWPTHPELLDYLATEFEQSGWNIKHMVRLMVLSGAYRQCSASNATLDERDPFNRLYARQSTFRLDAEFVHDNALAIAGLLTNHIGGPSIKPYQPAGYWDYLNFPKRTYENDHGPKLYRRGLYIWWQRSFLHPSLLAFDAPSREEATCERARSNTPQQALTLLDDPIYTEAARVFAERIVRSTPDSPAQMVAAAFQRALGRAPGPRESKVLVDLYNRHRAEYAADVPAAKKVIAAGEAPVAKDLDPVRLAAFTSVTRTILNLHETISRD